MPTDFGVMMPIFKVAEVKKLKCGSWGITQNSLELSIRNLVQTVVQARCFTLSDAYYFIKIDLKDT